MKRLDLQVWSLCSMIVACSPPRDAADFVAGVISQPSSGGGRCDPSFVTRTPPRHWTVSPSGDQTGQADFANLTCVAQEMRMQKGSRLALEPGDFYLNGTVDFMDVSVRISGVVGPGGEHRVKIHNAPGVPFDGTFKGVELRGGPLPALLAFRLDAWDPDEVADVILEDFTLEGLGDYPLGVWLAGYYHAVGSAAPPAEELEYTAAQRNVLWRNLHFKHIGSNIAWGETNFYEPGHCSGSGAACVLQSDCPTSEACDSVYLNFYFTPLAGSFVYEDLLFEDGFVGWDSWGYTDADLVYRNITTRDLRNLLVELGDVGDSNVTMSGIHTENSGSVLVTLAGVQAQGLFTGGLPDWLVVPQSMPGPTSYHVAGNDLHLFDGAAFEFNDFSNEHGGPRTHDRVTVEDNTIRGEMWAAVRTFAVNGQQGAQGSRCTIRRNRFTGVNAFGPAVVALEATQHCRVEHNTFTDVVGPGVALSAGSHDNEIAHDDFSAGGFPGRFAQCNNRQVAVSLDGSTHDNLVEHNSWPAGRACDFILDRGSDNGFGWCPDAPEALFGTGASGGLSYEITFGATGPFSTAVAGLVAASTVQDIVVDDPTNDLMTALQTGVGVNLHEVQLPPGTSLARFALFDDRVDGEFDDLDLFVFAGTLADLAACAADPDAPGCQPLGASLTGTAEEQVDLASPAAGTYVVAIHGWETDGPDAEYTFFWWALPATDAGNSTLTAPATGTEFESATVDASWTLDPGEMYLGRISYDPLLCPSFLRVDTE